MKIIQRLAIGIFLSGTIAIGAQGQTINTDEETAQPKQGLYLVEGTKVDIAYVHPDFNLAKYNRILVGPLAFSLEESNKKAEKKRRRMCSKSMDKLACARGGSFTIDENDQNKLADLFAEIMAQHMDLEHILRLFFSAFLLLSSREKANGPTRIRLYLAKLKSG